MHCLTHIFFPLSFRFSSGDAIDPDSSQSNDTDRKHSNKNFNAQIDESKTKLVSALSYSRHNSSFLLNDEINRFNSFLSSLLYEVYFTLFIRMNRKHSTFVIIFFWPSLTKIRSFSHQDDRYIFVWLLLLRKLFERFFISYTCTCDNDDTREKKIV